MFTHLMQLISDDKTTLIEEHKVNNHSQTILDIERIYFFPLEATEEDF